MHLCTCKYCDKIFKDRIKRTVCDKCHDKVWKIAIKNRKWIWT